MLCFSQIPKKKWRLEVVVMDKDLISHDFMGRLCISEGRMNILVLVGVIVAVVIIATWNSTTVVTVC